MADDRVVIRSEGDDCSVRLFVVAQRQFTTLATPAGWTVSSVVELTDNGLLVANVRNAAGSERPAVWKLGT